MLTKFEYDPECAAKPNLSVITDDTSPASARGQHRLPSVSSSAGFFSAPGHGPDQGSADRGKTGKISEEAGSSEDDNDELEKDESDRNHLVKIMKGLKKRLFAHIKADRIKSTCKSRRLGLQASLLGRVHEAEQMLARRGDQAPRIPVHDDFSLLTLPDIAVEHHRTDYGGRGIGGGRDSPADILDQDAQRREEIGPSPLVAYSMLLSEYDNFKLDIATGSPIIRLAPDSGRGRQRGQGTFHWARHHEFAFICFFALEWRAAVHGHLSCGPPATLSFSALATPAEARTGTVGRRASEQPKRPIAPPVTALGSASGIGWTQGHGVVARKRSSNSTDAELARTSASISTLPFMPTSKSSPAGLLDVTNIQKNDTLAPVQTSSGRP
ncbi:hypothetical protein V8E36_007356 [Tilletia maclaganii]